MVVAARVAIEEPAHERDERDALKVGAPLVAGDVGLGAQRLEAMRVAECLGGDRRDDLHEADVRVGEGRGILDGAHEDRADVPPLPLNRHHDDRPDVARRELVADDLERRIGERVGDEHRLARLEGALELRVAIEVDDEIANRRILIAGDEADLVLLAGEEDRAAIEPEGVAQLAGDGLQDVDEVERRGDFLQDVDDGRQVVAFALQGVDLCLQARDLIASRLVGALRIRLRRVQRRVQLRCRHLRIGLIHRLRCVR